MKAEWDGKGWNIPEKVIEWRGIAYDPVQRTLDLHTALEELKKEFDELMTKEEETQ